MQAALTFSAGARSGREKSQLLFPELSQSGEKQEQTLRRILV